MADQVHEENEDIAKWVTNGHYTPDAILSRRAGLWQSEEAQIARLISESSNSKRLSESEFIAHLQKQDRSFESEDGIDAARIVFSSVRYLANLPFVSRPSHPDGLTAKELSGAALYLFHEPTPYWMSYTTIYHTEPRARTLADYRRVLFQSLAIPNDRLSHDPDDWYQYALDNAVAGLPNSIHDNICNRDDDGDELYHDFVDLLYHHQPQRQSPSSGETMSRVPRDEWRGLARRLHNTNVRLHQLSIPTERFRTLVRGLLPAQWPGQWASGSRLASYRAVAGSSDAVECILRAFGQDPEGITWPTFNDAFLNAAPYLLDPMLINLSQLLLGEVCFDLCGTHTYEPLWAPRPGMIATPAVLDQLGTIFSAIQISEFQFTRFWDRADKPSAATLFAELDERIERRRSVILLIEGKFVADGGKCIFGVSKGVLSAYLQKWYDDQCGYRPELENIPAKLFQLYPVQDIFLEDHVALLDGSLRFEGASSPAFMSLDPAMDGGCVNAGRETTGSKAFGLSQSRQRGLARFTIEELEIWEQWKDDWSHHGDDDE